MNPPIEEGDLKTLLIELNPVCMKWRDLGRALGMQTRQLDIIEANARESREPVERTLERMLIEWLNSGETRWSDLVKALDSPLVSQTVLAKKIRNKHCRDFILRSEKTIRQQSPPLRREHHREHHRENHWEHPFRCDDRRGTAALLTGVISLCVVFAFGGITLMVVGISGLVGGDDDYRCSLGPTDVFNSLNLITGVVFLSGLAILIVYLFFFFFNNINKKVEKVVTVGAIATSLVLLVVDVIYSFYAASELLPAVERWERNKTLCHEAIFRSSFGIIVTYFLIIFVLIVVGAVALSYSVYLGIGHLKRKLRGDNR